MSWKGVTIMDQRVRFISEYLEGYFLVAELMDGMDGVWMVSGLHSSGNVKITLSIIDSHIYN